MSFACNVGKTQTVTSVNLLFKQKLETTLRKHDKVLIDVGTCSLHIASNAFHEGLKILSADFNINLDQIILDLYGFFKCSAKRSHESVFKMF